MRKLHDSSKGLPSDKKRCALCGHVDAKEQMVFDFHEKGKVEVIKGVSHQIAVWHCQKCKNNQGAV